MRIIDADELKKQAYRSGDWDKPLVVDVEAIDDAPTIDQWHYPSKGEYPTSGADVWDGSRVVSYLPDLKKWVVDAEYAIDEPRCWCYLPEPPKEEV